MNVFVLERVTPALRGTLTRWMLEVQAGVFVGSLSSRVREVLWERICDARGARGAAFMIYSTPSEQGFVMQTAGDTTRQLADFDGLQLIRRPDRPRGT